MNDLEKSELVVAETLAHLMGTGLRGSKVSANILNDSTAVEEEFFQNVIRWLSDEGIIRHRDIIPDDDDPKKVYYDKTVLTAYGFSLLGQQFGSDRELTVGKAIKDVSSGSGNWASLGDFFGGVLGGLSKSLNS